MSSVLADTHAIIWYLDEPSKLSRTALSALRQAVAGGDVIYVSAISIVEIVYLVEKGRLLLAARIGLEEAIESLDSSVISVPLDTGIARTIDSVPRDVVPDMPDRIIAATAMHLGVPLVTRDNKIRSSGIKTIW